MSDLIDRQQAIEAICMETCGVSLKTERCMVHCTEVQTVEKLPPAQPERIRGRWLRHEDEDGEHYGDKCSECGEWYVMPYGKTNFCPNCGAEMRGEQNDSV